MSTTRSLFLLALCGLVGSSAQPSSRTTPVPAAPCAMPHGARIALAAEARVGEPSTRNTRGGGQRLDDVHAGEELVHATQGGDTRSCVVDGRAGAPASAEPLANRTRAPRADGAPTDARASSAPLGSVADDERPRARLARLLRGAPEPDLQALGGAGEELLAFLPLDRLRDARRSAHELVLSFDTGAEETLEVAVPARTLHALDAEDDELDPELRGRARTLRTDEHVLIVHRELRFTLDARGIAGVRGGDLEVRAGPFAVDLAVRTDARADVARDRYGRPLLAVDAHGAPLRRDGRWVVQRFERWIVLEALGHKVEVGLP